MIPLDGGRQRSAKTNWPAVGERRAKAAVELGHGRWPPSLVVGAGLMQGQQPPRDLCNMREAPSWVPISRIAIRWSCIISPGIRTSRCRMPCIWAVSDRAGAGFALSVCSRSGMPGGIPSARTGPAPTARTPKAASEAIIAAFLRKYDSFKSEFQFDRTHARSILAPQGACR